MRTSPTSPWLLGALFLTACAGPVDLEPTPELDLSTVAKALTTENGSDLNGSDLNGSDLNGSDLNGPNLSNFVVSVNYNPTRLPAYPGGYYTFDSVRLRGTVFEGDLGDRVLRDTDFIGAEFLGNLGSGQQVRMRITGMNAAPAPNTDLRLYSLQFRDTDNVWKAACRKADGTVTQAMPIEGVWNYQQNVPGGGSKYSDPNRFTFACMGAAIAKCTLWGYRPWASYNGTPLEPYHQACTRMVRADYCGNGVSYTVTGNRINFYDTVGIQQDTEAWNFEAAWDVNGARCFYSLNRSHAKLPCFSSRQDLLCGVNVGSNSLGVLLRNETPGTLGVDPGQP